MKDENENRVEAYKKSEFSERYLARINETLLPVEEEMMRDVGDKKALPPIFIVGVQRSGTTLLNQLIINNFEVAYPTNFISRFWRVPLAGSLLYKTLKPGSDPLDYSSDLGYTKGLNGPHEFGYFWNYWFPTDSYGTNFAHETIDDARFSDQLNHLATFHQKPLLFKNLHKVCFQIKALHRIFPKAIFIQMQRDPLYVAQSTYESRLKLFGSEKEWFGLKPPQYPELIQEKPARQIAKQIYYCRKYISDSLKEVPASQCLPLSYEELTDTPNAVMDKICLLFERNGLDIKRPQGKNTSLASTNAIRLEEKVMHELKKEIEAVFHD